MLLPRDLVTWVIVIQKTKAENCISQSHFLTTINPFFESFLFGIRHRRCDTGKYMNASGGTACTECGLGQILDESFRAEKKAGVSCFRNGGSMGRLYIHPHESRLQICLQQTFSETLRLRWYTYRPKYLSETRVWRLWFRAKFTNPVNGWFVLLKSYRVSPYPANVPGGSSSLGFEVSQTSLHR